MKRYIASDFHIRNDVTDYQKVLDFLDLVDADADEFLILGDFLELLWSNINIVIRVSPYRDVIERVKEIARNKSVKIMPGNHDWNITFHASLFEPAHLIQPFAENGTYYCHGHQFDWMSHMLGTPVDPIYWGEYYPFAMPPAIGAWVIEKWFGREAEIDNYFWGIALIHERASAFARKNGYNTVIFGHTHYPSVELRGGVKLYNTGDLIDSYSYLIQENSAIEVKFL